MVVVVLIINCHVFEKPKKGPLTTHAKINVKARMEANGRPAARVTAFENLFESKLNFDVGFLFMAVILPGRIPLC